MKKLIMLLILLLGLPVWAQGGGPKEVDNTMGRLDGHYRANKVKISVPDKEPRTEKDWKITLEQQWITMQPPDAPAIKARIGRGSIYDYGWKIEIDVNKEDTRYQILIERVSE